MKNYSILSLITYVSFSQLHAADYNCYQVEALHLNHVKDAFTGTLQYTQNDNGISGVVSSVTVSSIKSDLRYAPETEIAWFPDIYKIRVTIGGAEFFGYERDVRYAGRESLILSGEKGDIKLTYADSIKVIVDTASFEAALNHLFGLYEGCASQPAYFMSSLLK